MKNIALQQRFRGLRTRIPALQTRIAVLNSLSAPCLPVSNQNPGRDLRCRKKTENSGRDWQRPSMEHSVIQQHWKSSMVWLPYVILRLIRLGSSGNLTWKGPSPDEQMIPRLHCKSHQESTILTLKKSLKRLKRDNCSQDFSALDASLYLPSG